MKVLVLNCGSSSIKYQLVDMANNQNVMAKGLVERIGLEKGEFTHRPQGKDKYYVEQPIKNHTEGINLVLNALTDKNVGVISDVKEIGACGHRVAHGGEYFKCSTRIDAKAKEEIEKLCAIAPLHNPASLEGINAMEKLLPSIPQVAVFDTSFHQTMPAEAYLYAIPYNYYTDLKIRRYGFHGTSHKYVSERAAALCGKNIKDLKIINCHLGNGASICAINGGKSVDTSMGFTPVEGLVMGTRCGDLDSGALLYIAEEENLNAKELNTLINKKSGLAGISGGSSDMRDICEKKAAGDKQATYAYDAFVYRVKKYIGAYAAAMNGVDMITFAGGIGENAKDIREAVCSNMEYLGVKFDAKANDTRGKEKTISAPDSKVTVMVIPTNEELVIANDTYQLSK